MEETVDAIHLPHLPYILNPTFVHLFDIERERRKLMLAVGKKSASAGEMPILSSPRPPKPSGKRKKKKSSVVVGETETSRHIIRPKDPP